MIDIKVDFKQDYYNYIFHEVELLREAGFSFPKIRNDNTYEIAEYNNLIERIPFQIPRKIFKTKSFHCPDKYKEGLKNLQKEILSGESLFKHLSTTIFQSDYSDGMQFDFGIAHLHLGVKQHPRFPQLVERTSDILYCIYTDEAFYFLTIDKHNRWNDLKLLEMVQNEFPELLKMYEIKDSQLTQPEPTEQQRKLLRDKHINACIQLNGKVYMSPGGGVALNGFSTKSSFRFTRIMSLLMKLEYEVKQFCIINELALTKKYPDVKKIEIHFATFSKPLSVFDGKLNYKIIIDWNEKTIYPIDIRMERIQLYEDRLPF